MDNKYIQITNYIKKIITSGSNICLIFHILIYFKMRGKELGVKNIY
jgi:hypothetical protein